MNNGISGYNAGRINPYHQVEKRVEVPTAAEGPDATNRRTGSTIDRANLGPDLSEAEAGMIDHKFPESERMRLRLYGPERNASSVDPDGRGRRLDIRG